MSIMEKVSAGEIDGDEVERVKNQILFTVASAASILSCSERKVFDLVRNGKIIPIAGRPNRKGIRITGKALEEYIESITIDPGFWEK